MSDNISNLISRYLDGELDDLAFDQLDAELRGSEAATRELVVSSYIHSQLVDLMSRRRVQGSVVPDSHTDGDGEDPHEHAARWAEGVMAALPLPKVSVERHELRRPNSTFMVAPRRFRSRLGLAAAVLIAAMLGGLGLWTLSRPVIVAQLTRSAGCVWQGTENGLPMGTLLHAGQELVLSEGRAMVTFTSGAQVVLEGPTTMRLLSSGAAEMSNGRITTTVPTQAIGFTISSPLARFIDLGTEYGLRVVADKSFELNVFHGLVEVQFVEGAGQPARKPLRISEVSAVRYDAETGEISSGYCDEGERISL